MAFEFLQTNKGKRFQGKEIPEEVARLEAKVDTETYYTNGTETNTSSRVTLVDCKDLYPDLVTEETPIGGPDSIMYCLQPDKVFLQG